MTIGVYGGADIASATIQVEWLDVARQVRVQMTLAQKRTDYRRLVKRITQHVPAHQVHLVLEATGPYWLAFAEYLHQAGVVVSVLNPTQSAHFARVRLQRAKTDRVDAHLLCEYGRRLHPAAWTPPPLICQQLQQRLSLRDDLVQTRSAERNRLHALKRHPHADKPVVARLQSHIAYLTRHIHALDAEIRALLLADHAWATHVRRLLAVQGLGLLTVAWILVATHAFSRCPSPEQAAAFAGLAPHPRESGQWRGRRSVGHAGHAPLRKALYMAALSASRFNPRLKTVYQRLIAHGKHPKLAFCAVARKLLHIAWALVVKQRDFDPAWGLSS